MKMFAVKAIYDGENIRLINPVNVKDECEVIITFLEPDGKGLNHNPRILFMPDKNKPVKLGALEGLIKIPDDFNEPLDDLKEYMY
jgi:hypothetical protein